MKSADRILNQRVALEALEGRQVVPIPGLTGSSSTLITLGLGPGLPVLATDLVRQPRQGPGLHSPVRVSASPLQCARSRSPAHRYDPSWLMLKQPGRPEFAGRFLAGHPNDRRCPNDEQAPQLAVVLLADAAELLLAAAAVRLRSHTQPCRELSTLSKDGRIRHGRHDRARCDRPDPGTRASRRLRDGRPVSVKDLLTI